MEGYENHKWFEITDKAKNQMEKLLAKNPGKYAVSLSVQVVAVQDSNTNGDLQTQRIQ